MGCCFDVPYTNDYGYHGGYGGGSMPSMGGFGGGLIGTGVGLGMGSGLGLNSYSNYGR